jgi:hypothetical protein
MLPVQSGEDILEKKLQDKAFCSDNISSDNISQMDVTDSRSSKVDLTTRYVSRFPYRGWRFFNLIHQAQEFSRQRQEVIVSVIYTASDLVHPELKDQLWKNTEELNGDKGIDDDGNGWVDDVNGINPVNSNDLSRSTSLAGIIAGTANYAENRLANPNGKVKILPISAYKFEDDECGDINLSTSESNLLESLNYASKMGAKIVVIPGFIGTSTSKIRAAIKSYPGLVITFPDRGESSSCNILLKDKLLLNSNFDNLIKVGFQETDGGFYRWISAKLDISAVGRLTMIDDENHSRITESSAYPAGMVAGSAAHILSCYPELSIQELKSLLLSSVDQNILHMNATVTSGTLNLSKFALGRASGGVFYNGDWARISRNGPENGHGYSIAYDQRRDRIYLHSGVVNGSLSSFHGGKWQHDIKSTNKEDRPVSPSGMLGNSILYDEIRDRLLSVSSGGYIKVWEDGVWKVIFENNGIDIGTDLLTYDPYRDKIVALGEVFNNVSVVLRSFEFDWYSWEKMKGEKYPIYKNPITLNHDQRKFVMEKNSRNESHSSGFWEYKNGRWKVNKTGRIPGAGFFFEYDKKEKRYLRLGGFVNRYHDDAVYLHERSFTTWEYKGKWRRTGYDVPYFDTESKAIWSNNLSKLYIVGGIGSWAGGFGEDRLSVWQYSGSIKPTWIDNMPLNQSDYDGDGKADIALWHPATGEFKLQKGVAAKIGKWGDTPVSGDYDGDGKVEHAVVQRTKCKSKWIFEDKTIKFGQFDDIPVPLDYDNDGKADIAVFRKDTATWYFKGKKKVAFGNPADLPVPADYNGDGRPELATYTPLTSTWHIQGMGDFKFGKPGDSPVPADYDGDGRKDIATWNPRKRLWTVMEWGSGKKMIKERFGNKWDIPVPGDYNGDGKAQLATYTPMKALWNIKGKPSVKFGSPGDVPLVRGN